MAKSPPEKTAKFTDLEPAGTPTLDNVRQGQVAGTNQQPATGVPEPAEAPDRAKILLEDQRKQDVAASNAAAFNEDTRRLEEATKAKVLELTVDALTQGIDLALDHMTAGMTQSEAVRLAAEAIRKQQQAIPS